jgi:hypothetical protein
MVLYSKWYSYRCWCLWWWVSLNSNRSSRRKRRQNGNINWNYFPPALNSKMIFMSFHDGRTENEIGSKKIRKKPLFVPLVKCYNNNIILMCGLNGTRKFYDLELFDIFSFTIFIFSLNKHAQHWRRDSSAHQFDCNELNVGKFQFKCMNWDNGQIFMFRRRFNR